MLLSEYWSDDRSKKAEVHKDDGDFYVKFYEDEELILTEAYVDKSQSWAEAAAENFTMGIKVVQNGKRR
jgi:hypothetical protein